MTVNILEYFKALEQKRNELRDAHRDEKQRLEQLIAAKEEEAAGLEDEMRRKEALKHEMLREGIVAMKLVDRIAELESLIQKAKEEIVSRKAQLESLVEPPPCNSRWEEKLVELLKSEYQCEHATEVKSIDECWNFFAVDKTEESDRIFRVHLNRQESHHLDGRAFAVLTEGQPYQEPQRPDALRWLPNNLNLENRNGTAKPSGEDNLRKAPPLAFVDQGGSLILQLPSSAAISGCGIKNPEEIADFKERILSLSDHLDAIHESENKQVDLNKSYGDNPLLKRLRDHFASQIRPDPVKYEATDEQLSSSSIYQKIKKEWDCVASCPWSNDITGPLAMLKYLVENGERASFWVAGFKNYYGFRLRTRDHTWIKGYMFIDSSRTVDLDQATLQIVRADRTWDGHTSKEEYILMGNVWFQVEESRD
jgi:hypothetical protein